GSLVLERIERQEVHGESTLGHGEAGDVDVLRDGLQAEHAVEAERDSELDAVVERLGLLHRTTWKADDLVIDPAETLEADQQVVETGPLQLLALLASSQGDRVGDERRVEADLVAVADELLDVPPDRGLAALDVDRGVAILVAKRVADLLRLLDVHELVLGVLLVLDPIEEVAEVAADVARLAEPEHASAREQLLTRAEVATEAHRTGDAGVRRVRSLSEHATLRTLHSHLPRLSSIPCTARSLLVEFGHLRNARNVRTSGGSAAGPLRHRSVRSAVSSRECRFVKSSPVRFARFRSFCYPRSGVEGPARAAGLRQSSP